MSCIRHLTRPSLVLKNVSAYFEFPYIVTRAMTTESNATSIPQYGTLAISVPKPFVFHVVLNRPQKRNAMNHEMWQDIRNCFEELSENEDCRSIVISGSGASFCAGIDVDSFLNIGSKFADANDVARKCKVVYKSITMYQESLSALEKCVKPVITAVHGACIGAALDMITAADIRYCTSDAWFQVKEVDLGLAPDVGTIQRLPRVIGNASLARELVYTARKLSADEANQIGLVSQLFDSKESLIEGSINLAAEIALKSPVAVQTAKRSLVYSQDHTVQEGLQHIALLNQIMLQSDDLMSAIVASATKSPEPPIFSKL